MGLLSSKQGFCVCPRRLPQDGKGFCACKLYVSLSVDVPVSLRKLDTRRMGQFCIMKVNLCLIEYGAVLLLCYQSMYSSCDTTAWLLLLLSRF